MNAIVLDVTLALPPFIAGMALTWKVIWPRWKVYGKSAAYLVGVVVLSFLIGHWSVVVGWLHQVSGMIFHIRFCKRHGFRWYAVEDPERYIALSKASLGISR